MFKILPPFILSCIFSGVASLLLSGSTLAQTAPNWSSVRAVGRGGSGFVGAAAVNASGNTYEIGSFQGTTVVGGTTLESQGRLDGYLVKYTPDGSVAWVRQFGSSGDDSAMDVTVDAAGNAYVSGSFTGTIALGNDLLLDGGTSTTRRAFVIRYSPQGLPEWAQQSSTDIATFTYGNSVGIDVAGNVYLTGYFNRTVTFGSTTVTAPNTSGTFLAAFSAATGQLKSLIPAFTYVRPTFGSTPIVYQNPKLAVTPNGEVYVINSFTEDCIFGSTTLTSRGNNDVLVAKYDAQGKFEWVQQFGGPADDRFNAAVADASGNLYITAYFKEAAIFGNTTVSSAGNFDACLVKYAPQGTMEWVKASGGPGSDGWSGVSVDAAGNPYVTGNFTEVARFGSTTLTSVGSNDIVVAAYTPEGEIRWVQQAGSPGADTGSYIGLDAQNKIYIIGRFGGSCTFGPLTLNTADSQETFFARLGNTVLTIQASYFPVTALTLYPNPATDAVQLSSVPAGSRVQLFDALGREVRTSLVASNTTLSVRGLISGIYMLRATAANGRQYTGRLLVE